MELNEVIAIRRPAREVFGAWARLRLVGLIGPVALELKHTDGTPLRDGGRFLAVDHWPVTRRPLPGASDGLRAA